MVIQQWAVQRLGKLYCLKKINTLKITWIIWQLIMQKSTNHEAKNALISIKTSFSCHPYHANSQAQSPTSDELVVEYSQARSQRPCARGNARFCPPYSNRGPIMSSNKKPDPRCLTKLQAIIRKEVTNSFQQEDRLNGWKFHSINREK